MLLIVEVLVLVVDVVWLLLLLVLLVFLLLQLAGVVDKMFDGVVVAVAMFIKSRSHRSRLSSIRCNCSPTDRWRLQS